MSTFRPNSSREHLTFSNSSIRSTRPDNIYCTSSLDTLVAAPHAETYRGFPSKEAYLEALKQWVDSKMYFESNTQLTGWYGTKTKGDYLAKKLVFEEKQARKEKERRATLTKMMLKAVPEEGEGGGAAVGKKENRLKRVFGRRTTVA